MSSVRPTRSRSADATRTTARRRRALDGEQLRVEVRLGAHAVLEVDQRPVEPDPRDELGGDDGPEVDEGADRRLAGEHPTAEVGARREPAAGAGGAGRRVGHGAMMPDRRQPLRPRASTGQRSTRPSGWTAANVETRSTTGQTWFGHDGDDRSPRRRRRATGQRHHAVVVVQPLDDRARPRGHRPVALDGVGQVLGQRLGARIDHGPAGRRRDDGRGDDGRDPVRVDRADRDLLPIAEHVGPGADLRHAARRRQRAGRRRAGAHGPDLEPGGLQRRRSRTRATSPRRARRHPRRPRDTSARRA